MPTAPIPSFPWPGTTPGSAGPYSAAQFAAFIAGLYNRQADVVEQGVAAWSGSNPATPLGVLQGYGFDVSAALAPNMSVNVGPGTAAVNGTWVNNVGTSYNLAINSNVSGNARIDTVVLHADYTAQTIVATVLQGTPGSPPSPPALTQSGLIWEIPLADVAVANGAASITQANITPRYLPINPPDGVYILVKNNSGVALQTGDVVVWDATQQQAVKTSTTLGDATVAGVMVGRTPATKVGLMLIKGVGWINVSAAVANGQALIQSTNAKQASPVNLSTTLAAFAYAMSAAGGAGLMLAYIDASQVQQGNFQYAFNTGLTNGSVKRNNTANYTTASTSFGDMDTANIVVTITPPGTKVMVLAQIPAVSNSSGVTSFDITVDGTRWGGTNGLAQVTSPAAANWPVTIAVVITGLSAGVSHTFRIQWKTSAGTATALCNGDFISLSAVALMGA